MSDDGDSTGEPAKKPVRRRTAAPKTAAAKAAAPKKPVDPDAPKKPRTRKPKAAPPAADAPPVSAAAAADPPPKPVPAADPKPVEAIAAEEIAPTVTAVPVKGWFRRIVCAGATRAFGPKALAEVRTKPWGGWSLGLAVFSIGADFLKYFLDNFVLGLFAVSVIAFVAFSASAAALGAARSIAPSVLSFIATVVFGGMLLAEVTVGTANGAVATAVPVLADWQEALAKQLGRIETTVVDIKDTTTDIKDTTDEIKDTTAEIKSTGDETKQQILELNQRVTELVFIVKQQQEGQQAEKAGIADAAFTQLATEVTADVPDQDQATTELKEALSLAIEVVNEGRTQTADDLVGTALRQIADFSRKGDFEGATKVADDAIAKWSAAKGSTEDGIALMRAAFSQDLLRRDAKTGAGRLAAINKLQFPDDADARWAALRKQIDEFHHTAQDKGLVLQSEVAIELLRIAATEAPSFRQKIAVVNELAQSLRIFGDWQSAPAVLEESLQVSRDLIAEAADKMKANDVAVLQGTLASALITLGERDDNVPRFEEAVTLARAATAAFRRLGDKQLPAMLTVLGSVLDDLGEAKDDVAMISEGIGYLREAAGSYRIGGGERNRLLALNALGNALRGLGMARARGSDIAESVGVFETALAEIDRTTQPVVWATLQGNLAIALTTLADYEDAEANLKKAITAFEHVLEFETRDRVPFDWANAESNLGITYMKLGMVTGQTPYFDEAEAAFKLVEEEYRQGGMQHFIDRLDGLFADLAKARANAKAAPPAVVAQPAPTTSPSQPGGTTGSRMDKSKTN